MVTERNFDMKAENEVNKFLNNYFYPIIFPEYTKGCSLNMQLAGIDTSSRNMLIDEKCQLERLNTNFIKTQCLELGFINRARKFSLGWYLDPRKQTTHYLFTWIVNCSKTDKRYLTEQDINCMRAVLVSVKKLKQHLEFIGITDKILHKEMLNMIVHKKADRICNNKMYIDLQENTRVVRSMTKKEAPINFVVPLYIYNQCCDSRYMITKDSVVQY